MQVILFDFFLLLKLNVCTLWVRRTTSSWGGRLHDDPCVCHVDRPTSIAVTIDALIADTSPQLGGELDLNGIGLGIQSGESTE